MRIEWIRDLNEIENLEHVWTELEKQVKNRTAYCCFSYITAWYRCYCGTELVDNGSPLVGLAWDADRLVGIAPMIEANASYARVPVRRAVCAGNNLSAGELLIEDDSQLVAEEFAQSLCDEENFDVTLLNGLPVQSRRFDRFLAHCNKTRRRHEIREFDSYAVVDLKNGYDAYNMSFGWKFRSRNKHIAKKIRESGSVRIERLTSTEDREQATDIADRMELIQNRSRRTRLAGLELERMHHPFYRELFEVYGSRAAIDATILSIDDHDVAFIFAFVERGIYYHTRMAFVEDFSHLSPGKFLLQEVFRNISEAGLHTVFSHGQYEYKSRWASEIVPQETICIFGNGLRAWLARLASARLTRRQTA